MRGTAVSLARSLTWSLLLPIPALCGLPAAGLAAPAIWRVEADRSGPQPTIQAAIDAAADGDTILVGPGTYTGEGNRDIELRGKAVAVIGREGPERTILQCEGVRGDPHRGFHIHEHEGPGTLIQGFTITKGYVEGKLPACYGGAILCMHSSPTIRECRLVANRSNHFGGGMVCYLDASPTLERVHFIDNQAVNNGGGLGSKMRCHPKLSEVLFVGNYALRGGALWCLRAGGTIERATFYGNKAEMSAAAVWSNESELTIRESIIGSSVKGSALSGTVNPPSIRLIDCDLFGNEAGDELPGFVAGTGVFSLDPLFCDPAGGDYGVRADSPCAPGRHPAGVRAAGWIGAMAGCKE
jgi:hypothetical protein